MMIFEATNALFIAPLLPHMRYHRAGLVPYLQ